MPRTYRYLRAFFALAMAIGIGGAHAASLPGIAAGTTTPQQAASAAYQEAVVSEMTQSVAAGQSAGVVHRIVIGSSEGTLLPAVAQTTQAAGAAGATQVTQENAQVMSNLLNGQTASGTALNSTQVVSDLRAVSGQRVTNGPGANTGQMTLGGISQAIGTQVAKITDERRGLVEKFGSDSALASRVMNEGFCNRIWASGFYINQDMDEKDGYAAYEYEAYGASVGLDRAFGPITVGAAFTYSRGDYSEKGARDDNTIDNYGGSLYANYYNPSGFFVSAFGGYNYGKNDMKTWFNTTNSWYRGKNHTDSFWGGGNIGYDIHISESFTLTPTVGVMYMHSKGSSYTAAADSFTQRIGKISSKSWQLPAELSARYKVMLDDCSSLTFRVTGGYTHNFTNEGASGQMFLNDMVGATPVLIQGVKPGRHGWNAGAGIKYQRNRFDIGVDYRYDGKSKYDGHRVAATFGISF